MIFSQIYLSNAPLICDLDREKTDVKLLPGLIKNVPFFLMYFYFIAAKKVHLPQLSFLRLSVICRISLGQVFH